MKIGDKFEIDDSTLVVIVYIVMAAVTLIFAAPYMK